MPKFDDFSKVLELLCRKHGVSLSPEPGGIAVRDLLEGDDPVEGLVNHTRPPRPPEPEEDTVRIPREFQTLIEAEKHPGYVPGSKRSTEREAEQLSAQYPDSEVARIGWYKKPRGFVVVRRVPKGKS